MATASKIDKLVAGLTLTWASISALVGVASAWLVTGPSTESLEEDLVVLHASCGLLVTLPAVLGIVGKQLLSGSRVTAIPSVGISGGLIFVEALVSVEPQLTVSPELLYWESLEEYGWNLACIRLLGAFAMVGVILGLRSRAPATAESGIVE